jgi:predicted O-methyltransferase YrrM
MTMKSPLPRDIQAYIDAASAAPDLVQQALRAETAPMAHAQMQITHDQAVLLAMLVRITGARAVLEIGVFTGYSALAMAQALPEDGQLVACDVSEEWTNIARGYWDKAGVASRIDLRLAPALETIGALRAEVGAGHFDLAFIDADKENYEAYYEACLELVRPGGLILLDNMFWDGEAAQPAPEDKTAAMLRALALKIARDSRVETCLLAIGDGLLMALRR